MKMSNAIRKGTVQKKILRASTFTELCDDAICIEEPLEMVLRYEQHGKLVQAPLAITMRTPGDETSLIGGYLFNEGILTHPNRQIQSIDFRFDCNGDTPTQQTAVVTLNPGVIPSLSPSVRHAYTHSSCGVCGRTTIDDLLDHCNFILKKNAPCMDRRVLYSLPSKLQSAQSAFSETGGSHCCAIFDMDGNIQEWAEDIGRHNAMDKLCGKRLYADKLPLGNECILLSGRASFELVHKAYMIGCPILIAIGAPSSLAIETAEACNMTLIGFARHDRANIYSCAERINLNQH